MDIDFNATRIYASGCTGLTELTAPNATRIDASGCTGLVEQFIDKKLIPLLTATGKTVGEVLSSGCWECHQWSNCPMHAVFGVNEIESVPKQWRSDAAIFVSLFDAGLIPCPVAKQAV